MSPDQTFDQTVASVLGRIACSVATERHDRKAGTCWSECVRPLSPWLKDRVRARNAASRERVLPERDRWNATLRSSERAMRLPHCAERDRDRERLTCPHAATRQRVGLIDTFGINSILARQPSSIIFIITIHHPLRFRLWIRHTHALAYTILSAQHYIALARALVAVSLAARSAARSRALTAKQGSTPFEEHSCPRSI